MNMMVLAIILLAFGLSFVIAEMFIPGFGFLGITGIILIVVSAVITLLSYPAIGIFVMLGELLAVAIFIYGFAVYIKRKQLHGKIILDETLHYEDNEFGDLQYFLGKEGMARTSLRPYGTVDFNGISIEVFSDGEYISKDSYVKVTEIKENRLFVRQLNHN